MVGVIVLLLVAILGAILGGLTGVIVAVLVAGLIWFFLVSTVPGTTPNYLLWGDADKPPPNARR